MEEGLQNCRSVWAVAHRRVNDVSHLITYSSSLCFPQTKNLDGSEKEMLIASNKSLAEFNLSRAEEFQEKKYKLADMYQELREINASVEEKTVKLS